jgi:hypothetical protein
LPDAPPTQNKEHATGDEEGENEDLQVRRPNAWNDERGHRLREKDKRWEEVRKRIVTHEAIVRDRISPVVRRRDRIGVIRQTDEHHPLE